MRIRGAWLSLLVVLLVAAPAASAGAPGKWTQLGDRNLANIDEASLARSANGLLHVVWTVPSASNDSLVHVAIAPNGTAAAPNVVTGGWAAIGNTTDLLSDPTGLRVIFGGIRTLDSTEPNNNMNSATAG